MNLNRLFFTLIFMLAATSITADDITDPAFIDTSANACGCFDDSGEMAITTDTRIRASRSRINHTMTLQCRFDTNPTSNGKVWKDAGFICGAVNPLFGVMMTRDSSVRQSPNGNMLLICHFRLD